MFKMSHKKWNIKNYFKIKNILFCLVISLFCIPLILIFVFSLNKKWYDGMSVSALLYILFGILILIFDFAKFQPFKKLKTFFKIKKENSEQFTNWEKTQMKVLDISFSNKENKEKNEKLINKQTIIFVSIFMIIFGIILLFVSIPFIFI
ncbi:MAG: hypothetical protein IKJ72_01540 [Mycoplasmataceae bacterium]|nr:hypothetical protein [Mycoplasmataceae bacterium]